MSEQKKRTYGHGPDGLYCKQHAQKHNPEGTTTIYDVYVEYKGKARLVEVIAIETPKQFTIPKPSEAYEYARRVPREEAYLTKEAAIAGAIWKRKGSIATARIKIGRLEKEIESIQALPK